MFIYAATVERIVDGDTAILTVDLGFRLSMKDSFRLWGINAPERGYPGGAEATAELTRLLPVGQRVRIETFPPLQDKYGRWLARIFVDDLDVNEEMVKGGFAVAYMR